MDYGFPIFLRRDLVYDDVTLWGAESEDTKSSNDDSQPRFIGLTDADWIAITLGVAAALFASCVFYTFRDRLVMRSTITSKQSSTTTSDTPNPMV